MAELNNEQFNKEALKNAFTPEGLDEIVQITHPRGWIALIGLLLFFVAIILWGFFGEIVSTVSAPCIIYPKTGGPIFLDSPAPGLILNLAAKPETQVAANTPLLTIQNSQSATVIKSPMAGELISYMVRSGQYLSSARDYGLAYALFLPYNEDSALVAEVFVPLKYGKMIENGMSVQIALAQANPQQYGYLLGEVTNTSAYPQTETALNNDLENGYLANMMSANGAPYKTTVTLQHNPKIPGQYLWSKSGNENMKVSPGSLCSANIIIAKSTPISLILPEFEATQK